LELEKWKIGKFWNWEISKLSQRSRLLKEKLQAYKENSYIRKFSNSKMRQLLLIRHAKSSWDDMSMNDFDRPLNDRGKADAPVMAHRLLDKKVHVDALIASPAKRARKTAAIFAKEYKIDKDEIIFKTELYGAGEDVFYDVISQVNNKFKNIAVFSHNPGLTDFANELTEKRIDNIPTCGIFAVKVDLKSWADFKEAKKEFWFFDCPKGEG
jgi:phosphohistidine phosphatase